MKILYILKGDSNDTLMNRFIELQKNSEEAAIEDEVAVIDLKDRKNYNQIVDLIENSDKVIS